jgi:hypothetical protein
MDPYFEKERMPKVSRIFDFPVLGSPMKRLILSHSRSKFFIDLKFLILRFFIIGIAASIAFFVVILNTHIHLQPFLTSCKRILWLEWFRSSCGFKQVHSEFVHKQQKWMRNTRQYCPQGSDGLPGPARTNGQVGLVQEIAQ